MNRKNLFAHPFLLVLLSLAINLTSAFAADPFYESYNSSERFMIADAYSDVAKQYETIDDEQKAKDFSALAETIYPGISDLEKSTETTLQPQENSSVETVEAPRPRGTEGSAVRYYLGKVLRGVFTENTYAITSVLSSRFYIPGADEGLSPQEVESYLTYYFDKYEIDKLQPQDIYNINHYTIRKEGTAWAATIELSEAGKTILKDEFNLSGEYHKYYFREYQEGWRFIAIGLE